MIDEEQLVALVQSRIASGEYAMRGLPSERVLAQEVGAPRLTARKALQVLVDQGVLSRGKGGRLRLAESVATKKKQVALMIPSIKSHNVAAWVSDARSAGSQINASVRPVYYSSWDDMTLRDAIDGMDGVFLLPRADDPPEWLVHRMQDQKVPAVILGMDWSQWEVPSIVLFRPILITKVLDHLYALGHRHIDMLNVSAINRFTEMRLEHWRGWCEVNRVEGELIHQPASHRFIARFTRELFAQRLREGEQKGSAVVCASMPMAQGVLRAAIDADLKPGVDISVCTNDGELQSAELIPTVTCLERPDTSPYLLQAMQWMFDDSSENHIEFPLDISGVELQAGESTGPAPDSD